MSTDIHGGIEFRRPGADTGFYDGEPWVKAMDLWPLHDEQDYAAFGLLFGVRDSAGFRPLAAGRGLPGDLSSGLAPSLRGADGSETDDATWVTWSEPAGLAPAAAPAHFAGPLSWTSDAWPRSFQQWLVPAERPADVREVTGPPPPGLGEESHWPHVFAVTRATAGRFADDGVRLVVGFP
ncbi:hypothetical protein ACFYXS_13655 [Streptomyces sp. NPDC002574]|uniref:hypothetical protein n=1 Tax=Streptomyces sp. NPDC002574 TaxID=3364652 RepID=UPI0036B43074